MSRFKFSFSSSKRTRLLFVLGFALVGAYLLVATKAATPAISIEPESGISETLEPVSSPLASGGSI